MSTDDTDPVRVTAGLVEQGRRAGGVAGAATYVESALDHSRSRGGRPGAATVLETDTVKVVAFEFAPGDVLADHAAHHPVLIQVLRGHVTFTVPDGPLELTPGALLHLTPKLRHSVVAHEPTTLTVTMLLPHD